jgi:hypothetical protein
MIPAFVTALGKQLGTIKLAAKIATRAIKYSPRVGRHSHKLKKCILQSCQADITPRPVAARVDVPLPSADTKDASP